MSIGVCITVVGRRLVLFWIFIGLGDMALLLCSHSFLSPLCVCVYGCVHACTHLMLCICVEATEHLLTFLTLCWFSHPAVMSLPSVKEENLGSHFPKLVPFDVFICVSVSLISLSALFLLTWKKKSFLSKVNFIPVLQMSSCAFSPLPFPLTILFLR